MEPGTTRRGSSTGSTGRMGFVTAMRRRSSGMAGGGVTLTMESEHNERRDIDRVASIFKRTGNTPVMKASSAAKAVQIFHVRSLSGRSLNSAAFNNLIPQTKMEAVQMRINASPGCYQGDDGSEAIAERYNFYVHGKRFLFAPCSLGFFSESNRFRQALIWCITSKQFDQFILFLIFANSIILAIADYGKIDDNDGLDSSRSLRNAIVNGADGIFTTLFSIECTMKIIAMGLISGEGAYLTDPWNWMDFIVVFIGILAVIPGIPNVSALRTFRVLRPLRSLNAVAGIKKLVSSLLTSIPELLTVVAFLSFLFFLYGVIGVQLWSGVLHSRCRLTPTPVSLDPNVTMETFDEYQTRVLSNYSFYVCKDSTGSPVSLDHDGTHDNSPWRTPHMCYWPIAKEAVAQTCALGDAPYRKCPTGQTCGSDFDDFGNFRFTHPDKNILRNVVDAATHTVDLTWGFVNFDHIGSAALTIFQCITREGWSDIMHMLQDAGYGIVAVFYFVSFIIFGSFFMLNLTLAVIWDNFSDASAQEAEENKLKTHEMPESPSIKYIPQLAAPRSAIRVLAAKLIQHTAFKTIFTVLILLNTIILSLDQYPADPEIDGVVDILSFCLTVAFALEATFKIIGLGAKAWFADRYNQFDALVVVVGIIELIMSPPRFFSGDQDGVAQASSFAGLRSLRLFALFKLARSWPSLEKLLATMWSTIREVGNFSILFLLFMYIYALIGMQTFANQFRFDEFGYPVSQKEAAVYEPRSNFDTMLWSMITVFQILSGENWNAVMYDGWRSSGLSAILYFVSLVIMGNFIVLNLFLAILLGNFEESSDDEKRAEREREELRKRARVFPAMTGRSGRECGVVMSNSEREIGGQKKPPQPARSRSRRSANIVGLKELPRSTRRTDLEEKTHVKLADNSLVFLSLRNPIRKFAIALIENPYFDDVSLALIIVSTVALAIDSPLSSPDSILTTVLSWVDSVLTVLFAVEVVMKIIALGFLFDKNAYLRDSWNVMDLVITTLAAFSLFDGSSRFKFMKTLKTFRALRPLRMINRNPGIKLVVSSLMASIPQIVNVIMVCILVFTIFSIVAVNNFKGKLSSCQGKAFIALSSAQQKLITFPRLWSNLTLVEMGWFNSTSADILKTIQVKEELKSRQICELLGAFWGPSISQSFDNVILAFQAFFQMTTTQGWTAVMLAGVDATNVDMQPIRNNQEIWTLFFVTFIMVGTFFVMQLFVGVVIENFNRMKEKLEGTYLLSAEQREWLVINELMLNLRPTRKMKKPEGWVRLIMFRTARDPKFELFIMGCIILNTIIMALHYFGEEDMYRRSLEICNFVFAQVFLMEAVIKIVGLGNYYWKERWNIFDFVIVVGSISGIIYESVGGSSVGSVASAIRSFRVGRLFRLIKSAPSLRQLFNTLLITLPSIVNIGGLLFIVFFIYAALGVQIFAKVKLGRMVTESTNFQSITRAMVTLIVCATGERWNQLMYELASQSDCVVEPDYDPKMCGFSNDADCIALNGCGSPVAYIYFYSFTLLVTFILLNIFIAIVLEGFANEKNRSDGILLPYHYENIVATWANFDHEATGFIEWHLLPQFLLAQNFPLGFDPHSRISSKEVIMVVEMLDIPIFRSNKVFFNDVARRIGKYVLDETSEEPLTELPASLNMEKKWRKFLQGRKVRKQDHTAYRVNQFNAAIVLHTAVKALILREDLQEKVKQFTELASVQATLPTGAGEQAEEEDDDDSQNEPSTEDVFTMIDDSNENLPI